MNIKTKQQKTEPPYIHSTDVYVGFDIIRCIDRQTIDHVTLYKRDETMTDY